MPTSGSYGGYSFSSGYSGIVTVTGTDPVAGAQLFDENSTGTFTIVGAGSFAIGHGPLIGFRSTLTVIVAEPAPAAGDAPAIPEWVQAYGRAMDGACLDGWDPSWQDWAQPVTGGWVCTRSVPSLG